MHTYITEHGHIPLSVPSSSTFLCKIQIKRINDVPGYLLILFFCSIFPLAMEHSEF